MEIRIILLQFQIIAAVIMALLLRFAIIKLPKIYSYILWILVFVRIMCPLAVETDFGIIPSQEECIQWIEQRVYRGSSADESGLSANGSEAYYAAGYTDSGFDDIYGDGSALKSDNYKNNLYPAGNPDNIYGSDLNGTAGPDGTFGDGLSDIANSNGAYLDSKLSNSLKNGNSNINLSNALQLSEFRQKLESIFKLLFIISIIGTLSIIVYNGYALLKVRRALRGAYLLEENIYICSGISSPFTLGFFHPAIYIPEGMDALEQQYIVCHERVHIRRKDYIIKNIAFILSAFYWYNPFVWLAFYFLERDMEMSCDEKVIKIMGDDIRKQYSQSLLNFAQGRVAAAFTPLTFGENNVKQRVKNVLSHKNVKLWGLVLGIIILAAACTLLFTTRLGVNKDISNLEMQITSENGENNSNPNDVVDLDDNYENTEKNNKAGIADEDHDTIDKALEVWACAFTDRDGQRLYDLAADKDEFLKWDMVNAQPGVITFGLSSPWPWEYGYNIRQNDDNSAVIRYYMNTSAPEIYIADEKVYVEEKDGLYYIKHSELKEYYSIDNKEQFQELYGEDEYNFGYENTGYSLSFYQYILQHLINGSNPEYYEQYTDPVTAAVSLLHLGKGEGTAEYDNIPMHVDEIDIPWLDALSVSGEGSRAIVTYTFAEDNSTIEIVMELIEGSQGIWAPLEDGSPMLRNVYQTRDITVESGERREVYIQTSQYGIYELDRTGLTCIYPHYIPSDAVWTAADSKLYFPDSSSYQDGDLDYDQDVICVLDINTGEYDKETYKLDESVSRILPLRWISVYGGFINLFGNDGEQCSIPLINTGNAPLSSGNVWNGKQLSQLNADEQNAYGILLRAQILENPDFLMDVSNRTYTENYAYLDMDGDGKTEKISLSADMVNNTSYQSYDNYVLKIGDSEIKGYSENLHNNLWVFSPDGSSLVLALYEDGPSADPVTTLFSYENGSVKNIGAFGDDIRKCTIENGIISGTERHDVLQTDWIKAQWEFNFKGELKRREYDTYDFTALNDITLLTNLTVYADPDMDSESYSIKPQTVKFLKTDSTFSWIYMEGESGISGWFKVNGLEIEESGMDYYEVFEELNLVD